jgi:hypothetical protein
MTPRDGCLGIGAASEESLPVGGDLDAPPDATNEAGEAHKAVAAGFAKSERDNIDDDQLTTLREITAAWLAADDKKISEAIKDRLLIEVQHGD